MSDVLTVGEYRGGEPRDIDFELITAANTIAAGTGGSVHSVVIADGEVDEDLLRREGVSEVHVVEFDGGYNNQAYVDIIEQLATDLETDIVVLPHTVTGMDYAPAVAGRLDRPLVTNAVDVSYDGSHRIRRKLYGAKVDCTVGVDRDDLVVTVREGQFPAAERADGVEITRFEADLPESFGTEVVAVDELDLSEAVDITKSEFIVSIGLGVGEEENMEIVRTLAEAADATLASSRPIVERGWLPRSRQVGQSGETVSPRVYIAIGISGAIEHRVGMKGSDTIIAINTDPDAPIFNLADYGIVGDLKDVVPALVDQLEGR